MRSWLRNLASELRADILSEKAIPALSSGITSGIGLLIAQIAFATFIFSGPLSSHSSQGVGMVLFGNFTACLVIALAAGYRGVIAGLSPVLVIAMAHIGSDLDAEGDALYVTSAAAFMISAVAVGASCFLLGRFRLAHLFRFIPFPVSVGFVAGIGGSVCLAAISLMGANLDWQAIPAVLEPSVVWKWSPGVLYGIALYAAIKRWGNALILPASVVLAIIATHLALAALGISGDEARTAGLLFTSTADGSLWPALGLADLKHLDWAGLSGQIPHMLTLILVAFISVTMNLAGLELAVDQELNWDREFKVKGLASVLAGLGGGTVATVIVPAPLRNKLFGATTRWTGVVSAFLIGGTLFFGYGILELIPVPLVGGILLFAGIGMLDEGLLRSSRRLPRAEFGIVVLIFVSITWFGLLEGVGAGMIATLIFFAVRLSHVDPIESRFTVRERRSNKVRTVPDRAILLEKGQRVRAYRLRGYIFFGSVYALADRLRQSLNATPRPVCLLLDLGGITGFDFSGVNVLGRVLRTAHSAGVRVVLSAVPEQLRTGLEHNLPSSVFAEVSLEPNEDSALERCEDIVIAAWEAGVQTAAGMKDSLLARTAHDLERQLKRQIRFEELMDELRPWLKLRQYSAGEILGGLGARQESLQLLLSGQASALDASGERLRQLGPGDAIWPAAPSYEKRASVVADRPCRTMVLTDAARRRLEEHEEQLALKLYRYLLARRFPAETAGGE